MEKIKAAIIGSGNIGTDLMMKLLKSDGPLELIAMVGIEEASEGLERARQYGVATTHEGIEGFQAMAEYPHVKIVFDATSAYAHKKHDEILQRDGKRVVDLTPAAIGPFAVPAVNIAEHANAGNHAVALVRIVVDKAYDLQSAMVGQLPRQHDSGASGAIQQHALSPPAQIAGRAIAALLSDAAHATRREHAA